MYLYIRLDLSLNHFVIAFTVLLGVLYPWTRMLMPPQYAGLAMALSSVSVVVSSMSLKLYKVLNPFLYSIILSRYYYLTNCCVDLFLAASRGTERKRLSVPTADYFGEGEQVVSSFSVIFSR